MTEGAERQAALPNLVIAGVTKAGTTSLFRYLAQHPDVFPSDVKELRYFQPLRHAQPLAPLEDYAAHFTGRTRERYAMESTPGYFYGGRPLAAGMRDVLGEVKVVVSLRDPVERCWSWYNFMRSRARLDKGMSFEEYLDRCLALHESGGDDTVENQPFWGVGGGCYDRWIDEWYDELGDDFRVIFFEDLVSEPQQTTAELCRWLDLPVAPTTGFRYDVENKTEQYRSKGLQRAALHLNRSGGRYFGRHLGLKRRLRRAYYAVNREAAAASARPSAAAVSRLREFYRPHVRALARAVTDHQQVVHPTWLTADAAKRAEGD